MWTRLGRAAAVEAGPAVDPTEVEEDEEVEAEASSEAAEEEEAEAAMVVETAVMGVTEATAAVEDIRAEEEEDTPLEEAEATTETGVLVTVIAAALTEMVMIVMVRISFLGSKPPYKHVGCARVTADESNRLF